MRNKEFDYMEGIYAFIEEADNDVRNDDGIIFVDDEEDEVIPFSDYDYIDDDGIVFIGDDEEDDYYLGEDCIPLPEFDQVEEQVVVIDENYELDEYESDEFAEIVSEDDVVFIDDYDEIIAMAENLEGAESFYDIVEDAESNIKTLEKEEIDEMGGVSSVNTVDDKLSKDIARDVIEEASVNSDLLLEDLDEESDEGNWINEDIFGNDIESIIAEKTDVVEEEVYDEGSFEDWVNGACK